MTDLKTWRTTRGLTQDELADMLGTYTPNISRVEMGVQWPSAELMAAIEKATKRAVTASDLLKTYTAAAPIREARRAKKQMQAAE